MAIIAKAKIRATITTPRRIDFAPNEDDPFADFDVRAILLNPSEDKLDEFSVMTW